MGMSTSNKSFDPSDRQTRPVDGRLLWAFAVDATKPVSKSKARSRRALAQPKYKLYRYLVTACSPRLRERGVRVGMRYDEAKRLVPDIRVIVYNR